jgi:alkanesulfonate monooxygenase SsuD/methylene tetrahydromethanopterin reductase-like flavin-dependent oxidoreductase (luciferase family)
MGLDLRNLRAPLVTSATFRLPGPLSVQVAGVDQMSGGRVELGLGAGWFEAEHTA